MRPELAEIIMTAAAVEPIAVGIGSVIALTEVAQSSIGSMFEEQSAGKLAGSTTKG